MQLALGLPPVGHESWMDLFLHLARATEKGRWLVLFDGVSWMAGNDPEFLPKLKICPATRFPESSISRTFCAEHKTAARRGQIPLGRCGRWTANRQRAPWSVSSPLAGESIRLLGHEPPASPRPARSSPLVGESFRLLGDTFA
jgi:hypothetical protein